MRRTIIFLFASLLFPLLVSAQGIEQVAVDEIPKYANTKNDNTYDLNEYVTKHFVYPVDQMRYKFRTMVDCRALISSEGRIISLEYVDDSNLLDSFKKELFRVLSKTIWTPAMLNGKYISYWQNLGIMISSYNTNTMPNYILSPFKKVKKYIAKSEEFPSGMKSEELKKAVDNFTKLYSVFPVNSEINNSYARLLNACNRYEDAHEALRLGTRDTSVYYGRIVGGNAKAKTIGLLLEAMMLDKEGKKEIAKENYQALDSYISRLYSAYDLGSSIIQEDEAYKDRHFRRNALDMDAAMYNNTTDWYYKDKLSTEWSRSRFYEVTSEMRKRGLVSKSEIKVNRSPLNIYTNKHLAKKDYVLLAVQSLVTRLSEGEDMEKAQLISMIADEKVSDKVRKLLQGLYDQVEALKLSKDEIVNNVIMYAPVQDPSKTKEENKAAATEFYRIRDAINNVYHLDWLEKK